MDHSITGLRTERSDLTDVLTELAADLAARERRLGDGLPTGTVLGIADCIEEVRSGWESGMRSMRSYPTIAAFEHLLGIQVREDVRTLLVALDAKVIALDDIIDTEDPTRAEKVRSSVVVAFSTPLELGAVPPEHREEILEIQYEYWVVLSQLPLLEREMMDRMRGTDARDDLLDAAGSIYAYRSRDIDAFVEIVATTHEVDGALADPLLSDLRAFRARYLLYEDFRHIERDLAEGHQNPIIALMYAFDDPDEVTSTVEALYDRFDYTAAGRDRYGDLLGELERRPDDLGRLVRERMCVLSGGPS
jgi:hypothetical protein